MFFNLLSPVERFHLQVKKTSSCWLWTGRKNGNYGRFRVGKGKRVFAHRFSWEQVNGVIPKGLIICHKCDTPSCVNPEHLFLGTNKDNTQDMYRKGRNNVWNHGLKSCLKGHPYTEENTLHRKTGGRRCRKCMNEYNTKKRGVPSQP